jgi:hypothetical protein
VDALTDAPPECAKIAQKVRENRAPLKLSDAPRPFHFSLRESNKSRHGGGR